MSGHVVEQQGQIASHVWADLNFIEKPYCRSCGIPFSYESQEQLICASCLDYPPPYHKARSALVYDETSRGLILAFKHGDQTQNALTFVPWLVRAGQDVIPQSDVIVPVPLHRWRLWRRRYNQAALIAKELAQALDMTYRPDILVRRKATQTQGHLSTKEREKNVKQAFVIHPDHGAMVKGKNILLIDDVYTTGSTVKECAKVLKKAGAARVNVLTVARTVRDGAEY